MSIELRFGGTPPGSGHLECDWGTIEVPDPTPPDRVGVLMLTTRDYADKLLRDGPQPAPKPLGAIHSVSRHGDVLMAHIDFQGRHWSWVLYPAHWEDHQGPPVYIGRRALLHERNPLHLH